MGEDHIVELSTAKHTINSMILDDNIIYALLIIHSYVHQILKKMKQAGL